MGGRASTREFLRFFMMPGMAHCVGGPGANHFDYLSYLEAWVENGRAPDKMVGSHLDWEKHIEATAKDAGIDSERDQAEYRAFVTDPANQSFTRPVYVYPSFAKYKGTGDPNKAENFSAAEH
jgi:hypothetical protein